jgi:diguanylate cyclase (GGDEF)-like protein
MDRLGSWSTLQLTEFLAVVSACGDEDSAMRSGMERAAEALEAEVAALVSETEVLAAVGFAEGALPHRDLLAAARGEEHCLQIPGAGAAAVAAIPVGEEPSRQLLLARGGDEAFGQEELNLLRGMARVLTLTLRVVGALDIERALRKKTQREVRERKQAEQQLAHQALHDDLTGLPNRSLLLDRINHALALAKRHGATVAVLFADLDHFKRINDSLGHPLGDQLLIAVAARLGEALRVSDTVSRPATDTLARFGGDEFVVLCEGLKDERDATEIAERIGAVLARPFVLGDEQIFMTASVGVAVADDLASAESLVRDADAALYRVKEHGRAGYELFDDDMRVRVIERLQRENELRQAIDRDELRLFYQPIVDVNDSHIVGVEALIRWEHPERGLVSPAEFIPLAEETGMIVAIGNWVLEAACRQAAQWRDARSPLGDLSVAINVSARQLDARLPDVVSRVLRDTALDPQLLALEITETVVMDQTEAPVEVLQRLRALGVRLHLDDFGTGYSSLSYLQRLPLHALKLDRSFITGLGDSQETFRIVAAVVEMARALDMTLIAEGVETERELACLQDLGCQFAQGYHFARPMPAEAMTQHLGGRPQPPAASPSLTR